MKQNTRPPRCFAHALNALTSLVGIFAMPAVVLRVCPESPLAQPLHHSIRISGTWLPLVWTLGSVLLWLLMLSRLYGFKNLFSPTLWRAAGSATTAQANASALSGRAHLK